MSETGKIYQVQYPATVSGKVYNVRDVSGDSSVSGKVYQVANISGGGGGSSDEWQPDPLWPDIESITNNAEQKSNEVKFGLLCYGFADSFSVYVGAGYVEIITSDGSVYGDDETGTITHIWDKTKDVIDSNGLPVRYLIVYVNKNSIYNNNFSYTDFPNVVYAYMVGDYTPTISGVPTFNDQKFLQSVKINGSVTCPDITSLFYGCSSLVNVSGDIILADSFSSTGRGTFPFNGTKLKTFGIISANNISLQGAAYSGWPLLPNVEILPDFFYHINYDNISYMGNGESTFPSLIRIPDGLDFSNVTDFSRAFIGLPKLIYAGTVNMSNNTSSFSSSTSPFNVPMLNDIKCTLPSNTNVWFNKSTTISIESFRYIADHAPDVTATPRTLTVGSTNISRINAADPTIITDLNARGWTVN